MRVVITGCCGSGKTHLARGLQERFNSPLLSLDKIVYGRKPVEDVEKGKSRVFQREKTDVRKELSEFLLQDQWVLEGVYGELIEQSLQRATLYILVDRGVGECLEGIRIRGLKMLKQYGRDLNPDQKKRILQLIEDYRKREDHLGWSCHHGLFENFPGRKMQIQSQAEMDQFLKLPVR